MNTIRSRVRQSPGRVPFPAYAAERVYMHEFTKAAGLPPSMSRWQDTVDAMLGGVSAPGPVYLMIDQSKVDAASVHRRPGVHIDGCWNAPKQQWEDEPKWNTVGASGHGHDWSLRHGSDLLVLASDVLGCAGYAGVAIGSPGAGGDCSHIDLSAMQRIEFEPGRAYSGDALTMMHESIPLSRRALRTVVRLNVHNGSLS